MARKTGEIRKGEIIATTRDIIFNEGFSNFTIRSVAGRVGISEAAIYRHFANKEELLLGLLDSLFIPWRDALEKLAEEAGGVSEKLVKLVHLHLHHLVDRQLNPVLFFSEAIRPENQKLLEKLNSNLQYLYQTVQKILLQAVESGSCRRDLDVDSSASCVIGILQTAVIRWTLRRDNSGLVEQASHLMKFFIEMIVKKGN
ncbi:MAG: TetR/AcrR family transcriptional regulator [Candidatus Riflebacteria bacterium]|jgi:AcrR family transcriptional regulator|nr:TetR/AcrR family transcriptional regulator [Candidatus Riflebacteria bacterium]